MRPARRASREGQRSLTISSTPERRRRATLGSRRCRRLTPPVVAFWAEQNGGSCRRTSRPSRRFRYTSPATRTCARSATRSSWRRAKGRSGRRVRRPASSTVGQDHRKRRNSRRSLSSRRPSAGDAGKKINRRKRHIITLSDFDKRSVVGWSDRYVSEFALELHCTVQYIWAMHSVVQTSAVERYRHESWQWFRRGRPESPVACGRLGSILRWRSVAAMACAGDYGLSECRSGHHARRFCGICRVADGPSRGTGSAVQRKAEATPGRGHARQCRIEGLSIGSAVQGGDQR